MRYALVLLVLLCASPALAATISGTAYTSSLEVAHYSLLSIDTVPPQRLILDEGKYAIIVPQGTYTMRVTYTVNNRLYDDELTVNVSDEGQYTYDFILFPAEMNETQTLPSIEDITIPEEKKTVEIGWVPALLLLIGLVVLVIILAPRKWWRRAPAKEPAQEAVEETKGIAEEKPLPSDLESVIAVLKEEDGRTTQKELRKRIPCSEAKMSMMLTELEHKGRIERIKKGRGNLIVLK